MANAIMISDDSKFQVNPKYEKVVGKISLISRENFSNSVQVANKANSFVEKNTNGLIKKFISPDSINPGLRLLLINTIYFKANWEHAFKKSNTKKMDFISMINGRQLVDMMYEKNDFMYYEDQTNQILEMNYKDENYSMGVILPKQPGKLPMINDRTIMENTISLKRNKVNVWFPKFEHRKKIELLPILKELGVTKLFQPYVCKLDNIAKNIHVSKIVHEAVVIVDETGTEAAAATGVFMMQNCVRKKPEPINFKADHSFIYYIRCKNPNTLLFVGDYHG